VNGGTSAARQGRSATGVAAGDHDGIATSRKDRKANGFFETMVVRRNIYIGASPPGWLALLLSRARAASSPIIGVERLKINALQTQGTHRRN